MVPVLMLSKEHWKVAKRFGREKGLQAWRDKKRAEMAGGGEMGRVAAGHKE